MAEWITRKAARRIRYTKDGKPVRDERISTSSSLCRRRGRTSTCRQCGNRRTSVGARCEGRKQYRYHAGVERGQLRKYYRVREMSFRAESGYGHAASEAPSQRATAAAVVRLISELLRIGSEIRDGTRRSASQRCQAACAGRRRTRGLQLRGQKSIKQRQVSQSGSCGS